MKYSKPQKVNKSINPIYNLQKHLIIRKTSKSIACMQNHIKTIIRHQNWILNCQEKRVLILFTFQKKKRAIIICLSRKELANILK